ncbi:MAG: hypothetical protein RL007_350 [Bacteroidota bacterium]|jgi:hypothetical protein
MDKQKIIEVFNRISNSILSSRNLLQLEAAERLVELFKRQETSPELNEKLELIFIRKAETLHYTEWKKFRDFGSDAA